MAEHNFTQLTVLADASSTALFAVPPEPFGVIAGADGNVYFCDVANHRIWALDSAGQIRAVVGCGAPGNDGDGGAATAAHIRQPYEVRFDAAGNLLLVDMASHVVRRVQRSTGTIETIAGCGAGGFSGDDGPAVLASLQQPHSIALDAAGVLYIADIANHRLRAVDPATGLIDTVAGTGEQLPTRVGAAVRGNPLNGPRALAFAAAGAMVLVLREGNTIYRVEPGSGLVQHVAGTGRFGYDGDAPDARQARLAGPKGVALTDDGSIVFADTESHTVRRINPDGSICTLAGNGTAGDTLKPRDACLNRPHGVYVDAHSVLIGDSDNRRLLRLH